jgi:hypothetical protein
MSPAGKEIPFEVKGKVLRVDGSPVTKQVVCAVDVDIRSEQRLGHPSKTSSDGSYSITYTQQEFKRGERFTADLKVYVYDNDDCHDAIATSPVTWNAPKVATIDVVVGGSAVLGPPEFDKLRDKILPLLHGLAAKDLVEDDKHQDITFLLNETKEDKQRIQFFIWAYQAQAQTKLDPDIFYGLYREGISTDLTTLLGQNAKSLETALNTAMDENIIQRRSASAISSILAEIASRGIQHAVERPGQGKSPNGSVLSTVIPEPALFVQEMIKSAAASSEAFWKVLEGKSDFKDKVPSLQFAVQLGVLTLSHAPLVQELQRQQTAGWVKDFSDLVKFSQNDWLNLLKKPGVGIPAQIPGETDSEKMQTYSSIINRILENTFPTKYFVSRLGDLKEASFPNHQPVAKFFLKNPDFDFVTMRVPQYLEKNPDAFKDISNAESVSSTIRSIQRVYAVAPQFSQTQTLVANGIRSSMDISRLGQSSFVLRYSLALGGEAEALKVFDRAEQTHAMSVNLLANYAWPNSHIRVPILYEPPVTSVDVSGAIPDLQTLFGSMDMCSCEGCRSIDGPAAYLVDVLHFLKDRRLVDTIKRDKYGKITDVTFKTGPATGSDAIVEMTVKDVLFQRRPDIGEVELNCQNTNTPVPYIDLTLEVLENAVAPLVSFAPFTLDRSYSFDLDSRDAKSLKALFNPPLSDFASVTVQRPNEWWTVDELAFTYTIRLVGSELQVQARSKQTRGSAEERAANPQYMNSAAYDLVRQQVYPWGLPFDLCMETVRVYLAHITVKRYEVMESFSLGDREATLSRQDIAFERLGLTTFEAGIISTAITGQTGSATSGIWNLFGFGQELLDSGSGIPDPSDKTKMIVSGLWSTVVTMRVDIFLRQSGLTYNELLTLMQFSTIFGNPKEHIQIAPHENAYPDTCDLTQLRILGTTTAVLHNICRFVRLLRKLDGWTILDLGQVISSRKSWNDQTTAEDLLVSISHINLLRERFGLPISTILTLWAPLSTTAYRDYSSDDENTVLLSFYSQIFSNRTVNNQQDRIFTDDPGTLVGTLSENTSAISAALNMGVGNLNALLADARVVTSDALNLDNLSQLFRHATLSAALGVSTQDYLVLLKLLPANPFSNSLGTVIFVERAENTLDSGFSLVELNYLLRHDFAAGTGVSPSDDSLALLLTQIRAGLQQITMDNIYDDGVTDEPGETKKKLSLLNWEPAVIALAVATLNDTVSYSATLSDPLPDDFVFPDAVKDKISYDATSLRLSYSRVMTVRDRDSLTGIVGVTQTFKDAISSLFSTPRNFLLRNMRAFSINTFSTPLSHMSSDIKIPTPLKKKVFFDASTKTLNVVGALNDDERSSLLLGVDQTADADFIQAVEQLYAAPDAITPASEDSFLQQTDVSAMFDGSDLTQKPVLPHFRFALVLQKLLPKLNDILSRQLLTQKVSEFLGIDTQIVEPLLTRWVRINNQTTASLLRRESFVESNSNTQINRNTFNDQFLTLTLLWKITLLVSKFSLTKVQLSWLFDFRTRPSDPTNAWLDPNSLPVKLVPPSDTTNFPGWERLVAVFQLRDSLPLGEEVLNSLFSNARLPSNQMSLDDVLKDLCNRSRWSLSDVSFIAGPQCFNFRTVAAFQDELALTKISNLLGLLKKISCSPADGASFAKPDQDLQQARAIVETIKAKYGQTLWMTVARPLRNLLRDKQRYSLAAYLLAHPIPGVVPIWRNFNDLYAYYLMDVEMGPCQLTSRIKQAISVTQLFVQRCMMNLEPGVIVSTEVDVRWSEWKTLKSFNLTRAGRQIFMKPENFLDSALRDDRTQFFKDVESDLQQSDLTTEVAETALLNYLEKLDAVTRLEVVSYYHQKESDPSGNLAIDILHVFARSRAIPPTYYYRTRMDGTRWTAWEKVDVEITGDHLIAVVWQRRLYLFWALFAEKQEQKPIRMPAPNNELPNSDTFWEIKIAWSELKRGKWLAKQQSSEFLTCWKSGEQGFFDEKSIQRLDGRSLITFKATAGIQKLRIDCLQDATAPNLLGFFDFDNVKSPPVATDLRVPKITPLFDVFLVDDWNFRFLQYVMTPSGTKIKNMSFRQASSGTGPLRLQVTDFDENPFRQAKEDLSKQIDEVVVLKKQPEGFNIVYPHQDLQFSSQRPFFYQHGHRSFFVEPSTYVLPWIDVLLSLPTKVSPTYLDGTIFAQLANKPPIPEITLPYPIGEVSGMITTRPTLELGGVRDFPNLNVARGANTLSRSINTSPEGFVANKFFTGVPISERFSGISLDKRFYQWPIAMLRNSKQYQFSLFYHPFVSEFIRNLNQDGVDGLMQRQLQLSNNANFKNDYDPDVAVKVDYPDEQVDFEPAGGMSIYNWELFFHIPLMIAERLSNNQHFSESQKWFHYIFDPTDTSQLPSPQRFWRMKKFFETQDTAYADEAIQNLFRFLATRGNSAELANLSTDDLKRLTDLEESVREWRKDPFNPYLVARTRTSAFQKAVVMKYLDNLIAWGDQLFRQDTIEAINQATQIFILASDILGERPPDISPRAMPQVQTYDSLEPLLDSFSNALVHIEELIPAASPMVEKMISPFYQKQVCTPTMLYFCVPKNDKLLGYWDIIADRLFKIRNCMNLQGIVRELALFEPPIDPMLLVKASASGVDLGSVLSDISAPLPLYRYNTISAKALGLCQELQSLGSALLIALEKKDAEALSLLRSTHELRMLHAAREVKKSGINESIESLNALNKSKDVVMARYNYYSNVEFMNPWEIAAISMEGAALVMSIIEAATQPVAAVASMVPELKVGCPTTIGASWGGQNLADASAYFGAFLNRGAAILSKGGSMAATMGSHWRRKNDWDLQAGIAQRELAQYDRQIAGAVIRQQIAEKELKNHDLATRNAAEVDDFMKAKFSNRDLYDWMTGQLSTLYFQTYQIAYDAAKKAERAFAYELGLSKADFIQFGYWDNLKKGLLAGDNLAYDLKRMDMSYIDQDRREYEITRSVSLVQLDPVALIQLKEGGECFFGLPEVIFDLDFPGHYFRRIKSVSLTIPCVVGPYTSLSTTLSLLKSSVRTSPNTLSNAYGRRDNDPRFADSYAQAQSIVTSSAVNDSGTFEARDDRYVPFERAGVISSWRLQLPPHGMTPFDVSTISDVVLHVRYTARDAGEPLRSLATAEVQKKTLDAISRAEGATGLARMFSLRHEFPNEWYRGSLGALPASDPPARQMELTLGIERFPFLFSTATSLTFIRADIFIRVRPEFQKTVTTTSLKVSFAEQALASDPLNTELALAPWKGVLRTAKPLTKGPGVYVMKTWQDHAELIPSNALEEIMLVIQYQAKWT